MVSLLKVLTLLLILPCLALAQANIPNGTTATGDITFKNTAAPSTPASGKTNVYVDSTQKTLAVKNDAGQIGYTVIDDSGTTHQFIKSIVGGVITKGQPDFSDLSGTATTGQLPGSGITTINTVPCTLGSTCTISVTPGSTQGSWPLRCNGDTSGNVFPNVAVLTNVRIPIWEWNKAAAFGGTDVVLHCYGHAPHAIPTGTAKLIFTAFANDGTASHTMTFKECDNHITTTFNISAPSCSSTQNYSTTSTAYAPVVMTFTLQQALSADDDFLVLVHATTQSSLAADVTITNPQLEFQ